MNNITEFYQGITHHQHSPCVASYSRLPLSRLLREDAPVPLHRVGESPGPRAGLPAARLGRVQGLGGAVRPQRGPQRNKQPIQTGRVARHKENAAENTPWRMV